ncbi:MAG: class IV adenylate cyclase [archaeon]
MNAEIEAKFLDIDKEKIRKLLNKNGARLVHKEILMRRNVFDYPDQRLEKKGGWIRVRDEGDKITLSYKQLVDRSITGTKETSLDVSDFDSATRFLLEIGLIKDAYQETKREKWTLDGAEITLDTWPWIPTFVEIEGDSENQLKSVSKKLNFDWSKALHGSVETAYQKYYDVTEAEVDSWQEITFIPIPDWLKKLKK